MVLRTIAVPDPSVGQDWVYSVPGKWLVNLTGIIATLTTDPTKPAIADATGHGNTATLTLNAPPDAPAVLGQSGAFAADAAMHLQGLSGGAQLAQFGRAGGTTMDWSGDYTIEWWGRTATPARDGNGLNWTIPVLGGNNVFINTNGSVEIRYYNGFGYRTAAGVYVVDGNWHHYVWSVVRGTQANTRFYVDGVAKVPVAVPGTPPALTATDSLIAWGGAAPTVPGGLDEIALYPAALSAAQVAAHFGALGDFAAYETLVLADHPALYYHLDELGGPGGRQPTLLVTDGATTVEHIPGGFPTPSAGTDFQYSWQPNLGAATQSLQGVLTTIPLPPLALPAGYTVGTETFGLAAGDQWSAITLWWDDALQTATQAVDSYLYAPGAHLVYQQVKGGVS